jgi:hypothetical protein
VSLGEHPASRIADDRDTEVELAEEVVVRLDLDLSHEGSGEAGDPTNDRQSLITQVASGTRQEFEAKRSQVVSAGCRSTLSQGSIDPRREWKVTTQFIPRARSRP